MTGAASPEGTPVLCRRCGAATDAQPDLSVRCRFCGTADRLPPDALGRALEIRGRLTLAAGQVSQLASTEAALASIFERRGAFVSVMGTMPFVAVLVVAYALFGAWSTLSHLPPAVPDATRLQLVMAAAYGPFFLVGITLSFPAALLVGRRSYRRKVRPTLAARPPLYAGAAMRCRACGGDLPHVRDAFVACSYCRTENVLAEDLGRDAVRRLEEEVASYRARASGAFTAMGRTTTHMTRTLFVCFGLVYAGIIALGALGEQLIRAIE